MTRRWGSLEELEAAAVEYRVNWWRTNAAAETIMSDPRSHPKVRGAVSTKASLHHMVETTDIYRAAQSGSSGSGVYLPEREAIHDRIVAECVPEGAAADPPAVYFTIGCPGAGKTSVLRGIVEHHRAAMADIIPSTPLSIVDADRVRQRLPEYAYGLGADVVAVECYDITYGRLFDAALDRRNDIVYDTIGTLHSIRDYLDRLRDADFQVHVLQASSSIDLCRELTERRALEVDGRLVNPALLEKWTADASETIGALLSEHFPLAGWAKIDTSDMSRPTLIDGTSPWRELLI